MERTVRGKHYDTADMTVVKKVTSGAFGDPAGYEETLYAAEDGTLFLYTNGGAESPYPVEKLTTMTRPRAEKWQKEHA